MQREIAEVSGREHFNVGYMGKHQKDLKTYFKSKSFFCFSVIQTTVIFKNLGQF